MSFQLVTLPAHQQLDHFFDWYAQLRANHEVVAIDTETTGLSGKDEVVSIGAADGQKTSEVHALPRIAKISKEASRVNGINDQTLQELGLPFDQAWDFISNEHAQRRGWIAWNGAFDTRLLQQSASLHDIKLDPAELILDVAQPVTQWAGFSHGYIGFQPRLSLDSACVVTNVDIKPRLQNHASGIDAQLVLNVLDQVSNDRERYHALLTDDRANAFCDQLNRGIYYQQFAQVMDWANKGGWDQRGVDPILGKRLWHAPITCAVMKCLNMRRAKDGTFNLAHVSDQVRNYSYADDDSPKPLERYA